jgi:Fe-S-cluster-containing hydrogenase component 2
LDSDRSLIEILVVDSDRGTTMQTGVILASPDSEASERICVKLQAKGIPALQCNEGKYNVIADFVTSKHLEAVVVANLTQSYPSDSWRHVIEETGLSPRAISWVNIGSLSGNNFQAAEMAILVNLARLQHADLMGNVALKSLPRSIEISRRELFRSIPRVLQVESEIPVVLSNQCSGRSRSCNHCRLACPVNAVFDAGQTVMINDRTCIECGACARECPIGAIQCPSITDAQIAAMLNTLSGEEFEQNERALLLTCPIGYARLSDEAEKGERLDNGIVTAQIPCVASIGSTHYLWAASLQVPLVTVCPDISCKKAQAMLPLHRHVASSRNLLKTLTEDRSSMIHHLSLTTQDGFVDSISRTIDLSSPTGKLTNLSGVSRRDITLNAVRRLRIASDEVVPSEGNALPLFDLEVDDAKCIFCKLCERDCPDRAIELTENEYSVNLMFDAASCGGCMICERNCPVQAIRVSRLGRLSLILNENKVKKASDEKVKCENCGTSLGSKRNLTRLRTKLSAQGATEAVLRTLSICGQCKAYALVRGSGQDPLS